jgi:hypothetical protein
MVSVAHMPEFDLDPGRGGAGGDGDKAAGVGRGLHELALRYWSEGRPEDALRVDLEAAKLLGSSAPESALMADILSTLAALAGELRSEGTEQSLLAQAEEYIARLPGGSGAGEPQS